MSSASESDHGRSVSRAVSRRDGIGGYAGTATPYRRRPGRETPRSGRASPHSGRGGPGGHGSVRPCLALPVPGTGGRTGAQWGHGEYGVRADGPALAGPGLPEAAGLPVGGHRRAAGLRREELALLAGISVDYVTRLEQGRASNPSEQIVEALGRALRLSGTERAHLFHLAGLVPPGRGTVPAHITPACTGCWTG